MFSTPNSVATELKGILHKQNQLFLFNFKSEGDGAPCSLNEIISIVIMVLFSDVDFLVRKED